MPKSTDKEPEWSSEEDDDDDEEETTDAGDGNEEIGDPETGDEETEETGDDDDDDDDETEETGDDDDDDDTEDSDNDEDSDDDDDEDDADEFEDEHDGDGHKKVDDPETPFLNDVDEEPEHDDKDRKAMVLGLCVCALLLLAIAIGLAVGLFKRSDNDTSPSPPPLTSAPTFAPPTPPPVRLQVVLPPRSPLPTDTPLLDPSEPTEAPIVDNLPLELDAAADTTIYRDGFQADVSEGEEEMMLVQSGVPGNLDLPTAYSLIQFNLVGSDLVSLNGLTASLCLHQVPNTFADEKSTYLACTLQPIAVNIETLTGGDVSYSIPNDCQFEVAQFEVGPSEGFFCVDVTSAVFPGLASPARKRRGRYSLRRQLQEASSVLFMIDASQQGLEQPGDRFYSLNAEDPELRPKLRFDRGQDTFPPSLGTQGPVTLSPTNSTGNNEPCGICPEGSTVTLPDVVLPVPGELLPPSILPEQATCSIVDEICLSGGCTEAVCTQIKQLADSISPLCGCT